MNLRWRDPAAVMHRDFVIFNSNSTITAKFERNATPINLTIKEWGESSGNAGYTKIKFEVSSSVTVSLEITSLVSTKKS